MDQKIPKIIHYVWLGGKPLTEMGQKCLASWKKFCPDYEIRRWDETNFDIKLYPFCEEAYKEKKWAFVADVIRLYALVNFGGVYMDTDVELVAPIDSLLQFEAVSGFESVNQISMGLLACVPHQPLFEEFLSEYDGLHFIRDDGTLDETTNVTRATRMCLKYGLRLDNTRQTIKGFTLLPVDYLCPLDAERRLAITKNTMCIHHFDGSWLSDEVKIRMNSYAKFSRFMPKSAAGLLATFVSIKKTQGFKAAVSRTRAHIKKKRKSAKENRSSNEKQN